MLTSALAVEDEPALGVLCGDGNERVIETGNVQLVPGERMEEGRRRPRTDGRKLNEHHQNRKVGGESQVGETECASTAQESTPTDRPSHLE